MNGWPFNLSLDEASKFVSGLGPATTGALNNAGKSIGDIIGSGPDQLQQLAEETGISQSILSGTQVTVNALNNIEPVDIDMIRSFETVRAINGIGPKSGCILYAHNIGTLADLRNVSPIDISHFISSRYVDVSDMGAWKDAAWLQIHDGIDTQAAKALTGFGIVDGSVMRWNGNARTTTYVNDTRLTDTIAAADIATIGAANVTVFNPAPGGGTSKAVAFEAENYHYIYLPAILR